MVCFHPILTWTKRDNLASKKYYPLNLNCLARCRAEFWCCSLGRGFHDEIGTVTIILVPRPAAVWISSFASICATLSRILPSPTPALFSRRAREIPDPLSFTCKMRLGGSQRRVTVTTAGLA